MMRILSFSFFLFACILSCMNPLFAQKDTNALKRNHVVAKQADSEKVQILTNQNEELRAIQNDRLGDSLLQLKKNSNWTRDRQTKTGPRWTGPDYHPGYNPLSPPATESWLGTLPGYRLSGSPGPGYPVFCICQTRQPQRKSPRRHCVCSNKKPCRWLYIQYGFFKSCSGRYHDRHCF